VVSELELVYNKVADRWCQSQSWSTIRRQGGGILARACLQSGGREVVSELELVYNKEAGKWCQS
jgi:hypothetical protein